MQLIGEAIPRLCNPRLEGSCIRSNDHPVEIGEAQAIHVAWKAKELCLLAVEDNFSLPDIDFESSHLPGVETEFQPFLGGGAGALGANKGSHGIMGDDDIAASADPRHRHLEPALDAWRVARIFLAEAALRARQDRSDASFGFAGKLIAGRYRSPDDIEIILANVGFGIGAFVLDSEYPPRIVHVNNIASRIQYRDVRRDSIECRDDLIFGNHHKV